MYFPKSQIKTNLNTKGNLLRYLSTKEVYVGDYFETSTNQYFTGKTPQDTPTVELELIPNNSLEYNKLTNQTTVAPGIGDPYVDEAEDAEKEIGEEEVSFFTLPPAYINSSNINISKNTKVATSFYPIPSPEDYKFGAIERYFLKRINSPSFKEINKETFLKYKSEDPNTQFYLYTPFRITWQITGKDRNKVASINFNSLKLKESRIKVYGLSKYFKNNLDQFYKKVGS